MLFLKIIIATPIILLVETALLLMLLLDTTFISAIQASPFILALAIMAITSEANSFI